MQIGAVRQVVTPLLERAQAQEAVDLRNSEVFVQVGVPQEWDETHRAVVGLEARDAAGHGQYTRWTEGQLTTENLGYSQRCLTLHYRPSSSDVNEQGSTDEGFDPGQVKSVKLFVSSENGQPVNPSLAQVQDWHLVGGLPPQPAAEVRPLLTAGQPSGHPPLRPDQAVSGVSRFFAYADLHHWSDVRADVDRLLAAQDQQDLHAFRFMGGLDLRHQEGPLDPAVFSAMGDFLDLCRQHHQDQVVFTLLDGAIPNPALQKALADPQARHDLVETLRPFVREFGAAQVNGQPVTFDLVNEIHGTVGTEKAKQDLVHDLADLFVQEAPGAHLTVGVQNYRELRYWSHLLEAYKDQPVQFMMSFHLWEDVDNLPPAGQLNLPPGVAVGITEADPNRDMYQITQEAGRKGYDWTLFWTDSAHPYDPAHHHQVVHSQ